MSEHLLNEAEAAELAYSENLYTLASNIALAQRTLDRLHDTTLSARKDKQRTELQRHLTRLRHTLETMTEEDEN